MKMRGVLKKSVLFVLSSLKPLMITLVCLSLPLMVMPSTPNLMQASDVAVPSRLSHWMFSASLH